MNMLIVIAGLSLGQCGPNGCALPARAYGVYSTPYYATAQVQVQSYTTYTAGQGYGAAPVRGVGIVRGAGRLLFAPLRLLKGCCGG